MPPSGGTWLAYIAYIGPKDVTGWTAATLDAHLKTINQGKAVKTKPHGHHVAMKGDKFEENKKAREILCKVGIDPYIGKENLVFSPNWCHSKVYAVAVLGALKLAKPGGKGALPTRDGVPALHIRVRGQLGLPYSLLSLIVKRHPPT